MIVIAAACMILGLARADQSAGSCQAYSWGRWGPCYGTRTCPGDDAVFSYPMQESAYDAGRELMSHTMKVKQAQWVERAQCREEGTCPELMDRESEGPAPCGEDGFASDYPCKAIELLSFISMADLGYGANDTNNDPTPAGNDLWGWTDPLDSEEYVIMGFTGGSSFVRVTDPTNPEVLGFLYSHTHAITWRDMKVVGNYVYIVSEALNHGVQIFDLTRLRGRTAMDFELFESDAHYDGVGRVHNIVANPETNLIIPVGCTQDTGDYENCEGGLHLVDVSDPLNPQFVGCFSDDGYTHDAQCVIYRGPDERYEGREICFAFNEDSLTIVDITDRSNATLVSKRGYSGSRYAHQGWVTEDHRYIFGDDELDEVLSQDWHTKTYFWDAIDLENPELKWVYQSTETSIDHNLYIIGPWVYQANYEAGLRILYFNETEEEVVEVGYFDVLPGRTAVTFSGSWSNYPWFKNGMVAVSSIDYGLYLLQPDYDQMRAAARGPERKGLQTRLRAAPDSCHQGEIRQCHQQC